MVRQARHCDCDSPVIGPLCNGMFDPQSVQLRSFKADHRSVQSQEDPIPMGGTTSMWADGQMPSADLDPGPVQVAGARPAEAKAIVGRCPGQLALMRLRRDRTAVVSFWVLVFFILVAVLAPVIQWIYGYNATTSNSALLDDSGFPLGYAGGITFSSDNPSHHMHVFGVEPTLGRDLFMQIVWGLQTSLKIAVSATLMSTALGVPAAITAEPALSFLNIGVVEPTPDLGRVINTGAQFIVGLPDPMYLVIPGIVIFVLVLAFNLFGDALRDALDPRSTR